MTDQTPSDQIHPLAAMGIQLHAEATNAAVSRDFQRLAASLPDGEVTAAMNANRSETLREFIDWYLRRPGAKMPKRPEVKEAAQ